MEQKKIYCVYCGEENKIDDLKCSKCKKSLNPKDHFFKEFLVDHIKDDLQGNIEDTIIDLLKKWIISHLYGLGITAAILFTGVGILAHEISLSKYDMSYQKINSPLVVEMDYCKDLEIVSKVEKCMDGYHLDNHQCVKVDSHDAIVYYTCDNNYTLMGDSCISNFTIDLTKHVSCTTDSIHGTFIDTSTIIRTFNRGDDCFIEYCPPDSMYADGTCSGTAEEQTIANYSYTCDGYDLDGSCRTYGERYYHYTCNEGELVDNHCETKDIKEPILECPQGSLYNSKCNSCVKEDA